MDRAYVAIAAVEVPAQSDSDLFGRLARKLPFSLELSQKAAWDYQIKHLRELASMLPSAYFFLEFLIPRMGRRVDLVVILRGTIFVVEYKVNKSHVDRPDLNQVYGYALDLRYFHESSDNRPIAPILVPTKSDCLDTPELTRDRDNIFRPIGISPSQLAVVIGEISRVSSAPPLDPIEWAAGRYRPTPTIVEAAQALYRGHDVEEISRSEAGAENLSRTGSYIGQVIESAKHQSRKAICFITGVPGSGKTLAGLNVAAARQRSHEDEHAVFLSGNGPLVDVLREALVLDALAQSREMGQGALKVEEQRRAAAFIQNIHHFRDDALASFKAPIEKVTVFDEAQRAWDVEQTAKFMQQKRGHIDFSKSEPEFLLGVMDRHDDWCAIICLVGEGQEINTGEAGIDEWIRVVQKSFPHWLVHLPPTMSHWRLIEGTILAPELHLATSIRSFRAERLSEFVDQVIKGHAAIAAEIKGGLPNYPLLITRNLDTARQWLRHQRREIERAGLLASSNAARLKPHGIFVKARIEPEKWFLAPADDVRSSDALEDAATEFDIQGLELDWTCVCWDANLRYAGDWECWRFNGSKWNTVHDSVRKNYLVNSYRVLLTRARQGMVVFVPQGSRDDPTRQPTFYDKIYEYLRTCGFDIL